jgi:RimJ/RimL family protein N-acetyltransferase
VILLETRRLTLRPLTTSDLPDLTALDHDPEVMRHLGTDGTPSPSLVGAPDHWAATLRATGEFLGWFGLPPLRDNPEVLELGYRIKRAAWGHGYATEGAIALVDKAFTDLGARRVVAFTMAVNTGSRRVMEKTGLTYVRTFFEEWDDPLPGADEGDVEYALEKTQH